MELFVADLLLVMVDCCGVTHLLVIELGLWCNKAKFSELAWTNLSPSGVGEGLNLCLRANRKWWQRVDTGFGFVTMSLWLRMSLIFCGVKLPCLTSSWIISVVLSYVWLCQWFDLLAQCQLLAGYLSKGMFHVFQHNSHVLIHHCVWKYAQISSSVECAAMYNSLSMC